MWVIAATPTPAQAAVPAVATPVKAAPKAASAKAKTAVEEISPSAKLRRRIIWSCVWGFVAANLLMFLRFFFPRALFEPSTVFKIGYPSDFQPGVDERFKAADRIWVVREARPHLRDLRALHAPGLHAGLETGGAQVQVPVPRQRIHARKESTLKGRRPGPWIARTWNWTRRARSLLTPVGSIPGPRAAWIISMMPAPL